MSFLFLVLSCNGLEYPLYTFLIYTFTYKNKVKSVSNIAPPLSFLTLMLHTHTRITHPPHTPFAHFTNWGVVWCGCMCIMALFLISDVKSQNPVIFYYFMPNDNGITSNCNAVSNVIATWANIQIKIFMYYNQQPLSL